MGTRMARTERQLEKLIARFIGTQPHTEPQPYGDGHINDTYLFSVRGEDGKMTRLVLQRINRAAFPRPEEVMQNMLRVTVYLRKIIREEGGDETRQTLALLQTENGEWYTTDEWNDVWRIYRYIDGAMSYSHTTDTDIFMAAGQAFGRFQRMLLGFDATQLYETIAHFHDTPKRFGALRDAIARDAKGRVAGVRDEITYALSHEKFASTLVDAQASGELPLRVTHNDTKLNNVLIDAQTGRGLCVIDLDTVMPGLSAYDFGDAIRFGANTADEDERDLSRVSLSLPLYEAYARGYLSEAGKVLTEAELHSLPIGAKMMTLECGVRFLTDYLNGDQYFKVAYPEHNLARARNQFALVRDMDRKWPEMQNAIANAK